MTKRLMMIALMVLSIVCLAFGVAACAPTEVEHPETGMYYFETDEGDTYHVTLEGGSFMLQIADEIESGTYVVNEDGTMTLSFANENAPSVSMTYQDSELSVVYNGSSMTFMRTISYTVSYETLGGSKVNSAKVMNGKSIVKPSDPEREGYAFLGWYTDADYTNAFVFGVTRITADTTLYARWSNPMTGESEHTILFDLGYEGAVNPAAQETVAGQLYNVETPTREGYRFGGWWISDYESSDKLTYLYSEDYKFTSSTTLYAQWISTASGAQLASPMPRIEGNMVVWDEIAGANGYYVKIADTNGAMLVDRNIGATNVAVDFTTSVAGQHIISVRAISSTGTNDSETTVRYFNNKALGKVSKFTVLEPSVLMYNAVEHAEKYRISIVCGNKEHNHTDIDNGTSTYFDFSGCEMKEGGIAFTVTAIGAGYSSTTSRVFYYNRQLNKIERFYFDDATETVSWPLVENAADYSVAIRAGSDTYNVLTGGKAYISLRNYSSQDITISVVPVTKGYNSPSASSYDFKRAGLAAPTNVKVVGGELVWDAVNGAEQYVVNVSGADYVTTGSETVFDLASLSLTNGIDYQINVRALKAGGAQQSVSSDTITAQYYSLSPAISYAQGYVSWNPVIGATSYEVKVNNGVLQRIAQDTTTAAVELTQSGNNTVYVRFIDENNVQSNWESVSVYAYRIMLDEREGTEVEDLYVALGDSIWLPTSERGGYALDGWYTAPGGASDNSSRYFSGDKLAVASDLRLYAGWTPETFLAIYAMDEYATMAQESTAVKFRTDFKLLLPVMNADYSWVSFRGWFSEPDGRGIQYTDSNGNSLGNWKYMTDITVYPGWEEFFEFELQTEGAYKNTYAADGGLPPGNVTVAKIVVPETYKGRPVTIIEGYTFARLRNTTCIEIPDTIQVIYTETAFEDNTGLKEINVYSTGHTNDPVYTSHEGVLYYNDTLSGVGKTLITVPQGKTGHYVVEAGTKSIGIRVFASSNLSSVTIPSSVVNIDYRAFYESTITHVYFDRETGDELKLGEEAFANCALLESITLPSRLKTFDPVSVFVGAKSLENIFVYDDNENYSHINGILCNKLGNTILYCPPAKSGALRFPAGVRTIGAGAFRNCTKFYSVVIPAYITTIGNNAFEGCSAIVSVKFDGADTNFGDVTIGAEAFKDCVSLWEVTFDAKSNVVSMDYGAFANCVKMSSITLPKTLRDVTSGLFAGCTGLVYVNIEEGNQYLSSENGVVYDTNKTEVKYYSINRKEETFVLPDTIRTIGKNVFAGNLYLKKIVIGNKVELIGEYAFSGCNNLETLVFVSGNDSTDLEIAPYAFDGCASLKNFYLAASATAGEDTYQSMLPARLRAIGEYAFNKAALGDVVLQEGIETISQYAFANTNITSIMLPASLKELGAYVFSGCAQLSNVTLADGSRLETIGEYAFAGLGGITSFEIPKTVTVIGNYAFSNTDLSGGFTFEARDSGSATLTMGLMLFEDTNITELALPANTQITVNNKGGNYETTFTGAVKLANVTGLDNDMYTIRDGALYQKNAGELKTLMLVLPGYTGDVVIPKTVTTVAANAFAKYAKWGDYVGVLVSSVTFEKGGTEDLTIGEYAFAGINNQWDDRRGQYKGPALTDFELELPERLAKLGGNVFKGAAIFSLKFENNKTRMNALPSETFPTTTYFEELILPKGLKRIESSAFIVGWRDTPSLKKLTLNEDLEYIGAEAFSGQSAIDGINIPSSLEYIGSNAFSRCTSMAYATVPADSRLAIVGSVAFVDTQITSFTFPASFCGSSGIKGDDGKYAGDGIMAGSMFSGCEMLESVTFVDGCPLITSMEGYIFASCNSLKTLTLPKNVTEVGMLFGTEVADMTMEQIVISSKLSDQSIANIGVLVGYGTKLVFVPAGLGDGVEITPEGIIYGKNSAGERVSLLCYPNSIQDKKYTVPSTVTYIANSMFEEHPYVEEVVLPEGLKTIGEGMFYRAQSLKKVVVPSTVTAIEDRAFFYSSLETITLPQGLRSIGSDAFWATNIERINIPYTVGIIGSEAFSGCENLREVNFETDQYGNSSLSSIGNKAFAGCSSLESIELPDSVMILGEEPDLFWLETFGEDHIDFVDVQFQECYSLKHVKLPKNLVKMHSFTLRGLPNLETVVLPQGAALNEVGLYAFQNCPKLRSVDFSGAVNLESVGKRAFESCTSLAEVSFSSSGQLKLGERAFENTALTSFTVTRQMREIGLDAFKDVATLTTVNVETESRLTTIGDNAFRNTGIKAFAFENAESLDRIGKYAFYGTNLAGEVSLHDKVTYIGDFAFTGCKGITSLRMSAIISYIGESAFEDASITSVTIGGVETVIGPKAFMNTKLETVNLEAGVASIGNMAFAYTFINYVTIPYTVVTFDGNPFAGCVIEDMDILSTTADLMYENGWLYNGDKTVIYFAAPSTEGVLDLKNSDVTTIMAGAFAGTKITSFTLPESVTTIGDNTFRGCTELTTVTIGKNMTRIGASAFEGCTKLKELVFEKGGTQALSIGIKAFKGCTALERLTLPHRLRNYSEFKLEWYQDLFETECEYMYAGLAESAFEGCTGLKTVDFETVEAGFNTRAYSAKYLWIGVAAFRNCVNLESVTLFDGLGEGDSGFMVKDGNMISDYAFAGCVKLTSVNFAKELVSDFDGNALNTGHIGRYAFYECTSLKSFELPDYIFFILDYAFSKSGITSFTMPRRDIDKRHDFNNTNRLYYTVGAYVFKDCTDLEEFYCFGGFTEGKSGGGVIMFSGALGAGFFEGCTKLRYVEFSGDSENRIPDEFGDRMFAGCSNLETVILNNIGDGDSITLYEETFEGCYKLSTFRLTGFSFVYIYENAFADTAITELDLTKLTPSSYNPDFLYTYPDAFKGMTNLTIILPFATKEEAETVLKLEEGWNGDAKVEYRAPQA